MDIYLRAIVALATDLYEAWYEVWENRDEEITDIIKSVLGDDLYAQHESEIRDIQKEQQ